MRHGGPGGPGGRRGNDFEEFDVKKFEEESAEVLELRFITKDNAVFTRTAGGFLALDFNGKHYNRVGVYRTFPLTDPDVFISIREADEKAKEIGMIEKLSALDAGQQELLREQLRLRYYMPKILKVNDIKDEYGYAYFDVVTDFGKCIFTIPMGGGSVVTLTETRLIITDLDGNRFEIEDLRKFSAGELKKLDIFL